MNDPTGYTFGSLPAPKTSALAVWSLVLGILGLVPCLWLLTGIPAVICGHIALSRINRSSGALGGQGLAIAGLVTGYAGILVFGLMVAIAFPNFIKAREIAQRNICIQNLHTIDNAKGQWAVEQRKQETDTPTWGDLRVYLTNGSSGALPACPAGGSYQINAVGQKPTCSLPNHALP
jgi:hypothetical protein